MKLRAGIDRRMMPRVELGTYWEEHNVSVTLFFGTPGCDAAADVELHHRLTDRQFRWMLRGQSLVRRLVNFLH